jgi:hypothetical protein
MTAVTFKQSIMPLITRGIFREVTMQKGLTLPVVCHTPTTDDGPLTFFYHDAEIASRAKEIFKAHLWGKGEITR